MASAVERLFRLKVSNGEIIGASEGYKVKSEETNIVLMKR
ncbi:DUF1508 domain-containing protein [Nitrosomonas mobilis]